MTHQIIQIIFITTCLVWAVKIALEPGMVLERFGDWVHDKIDGGWKILEPLFSCPFCMPSIYTGISYLLAYKLGIISGWKILWAYPIAVGGASLSCGFVWLIYLTIVEI